MHLTFDTNFSNDLYNRIGERIAKRDQNGTVHEYEYDNLGRLLPDRVTMLATGVDGAVRRIFKPWLVHHIFRRFSL